MNNVVPPMSSELEQLVANVTPTAPRGPKRQFIVVVAASVAFVTAVIVGMRLRADWVELPTTWQFGMAAIWTVGALGPLWFLLVPSPGKVSGRWRAALALGVAMTLLATSWAVVWHPAGPSSFDFSHKPLAGHVCSEVGLGLSIAPALLFAVLLRGVYPAGARMAAVAVGVAAGNLAGLLLHLHCRVADATHLTLFHSGAVVLATLLAGYVAPLVLDRPWRRPR